MFTQLGIDVCLLGVSLMIAGYWFITQIGK